MTTDRPASEFEAVQRALLARWPENRVAPDLTRIQRLCDLLGDPQLSSTVIHVAGTNGKTSTARIIESLLRAMALRTGLMTSPALRDLTERIEVDGDPLSSDDFVRTYRDIEPYLEMVDAESLAAGGPPATFFEALTGIGYAAFADAPVDVAVVETGMGGRWDATNVNSAQVAVITPIAMDHTEYLGDTLGQIAAEKAGIIKQDATVVIAEQPPEVLAVLVDAAEAAGAKLVLPGTDYELISRGIAVGGQVVTIRVDDIVYEEVFLSLNGRHQAHNAALAVAAVRAFLDRAVEPQIVEEGLGTVTSPGRLDIIGRHPLTLADAAHNPHGMRAAMLGVSESFTYDTLVAVVAILDDKDVDRMLGEMAGVVDQIVVTANDSPRCMSAAELAERAAGFWSADAIHQYDQFDAAMVAGRELAGPEGCVIATGSVVTAGMARSWAQQ